VRAVVALRTRGELEALFADLPEPHPDLRSATPARRERGEVAKSPAASALEAVAGITLVVGLPAAVLLTIFLGQWWVFIPVGIVFFIAAATADALKKNG
jgi:fatty acid desaturase